MSVCHVQVDDPSLPNDEGITALHNSVCAGHTEIVKFLVQFGVNANAADSDGWWVENFYKHRIILPRVLMQLIETIC